MKLKSSDVAWLIFRVWVSLFTIILGGAILGSLYLRYKSSEIYYGTLPLEALMVSFGVGLICVGLWSTYDLITSFTE